MGNVWHNEMIMEAKKTWPRNALTRAVTAAICDYMERYESHWLHGKFTKAEWNRLGALCRTKSLATKRKRYLNYINHLLTSTHYGHLFEKDKIGHFDRLVGELLKVIVLEK